MTGNGNHTNYGDDWGMVYSCYTHITNISVFLYTYVYSELSGEDGGLYVRHLKAFPSALLNGPVNMH